MTLDPCYIGYKLAGVKKALGVPDDDLRPDIHMGCVTHIPQPEDAAYDGILGSVGIKGLVEGHSRHLPGHPLVRTAQDEVVLLYRPLPV